jgi:hypothetical protein
VLVPSPDGRPAFSGVPDPEYALSADVDDALQPAMAAVPRTTRAKSERFVSILMERTVCSGRAAQPVTVGARYFRLKRVTRVPELATRVGGG